MSRTELYDLLGVTPAASDEEIKRAYRRVAREVHPDVNPDPAAAERFKEVSAAYEILSDPEKRARYDRFGTADGSDQGQGFGGLGDIFEAFFGGASGFGSGPTVLGPDLQSSVVVTLEDVLAGGAKKVSIRGPFSCDKCDATGSVSHSVAVGCPTCGGSGQTRQVRRTILGQMVTSAPCGACGATGQMVADPCVQCHGEGRVSRVQEYSFDLPPGIEDRATIKLAQRGGAGVRGARSGDLYLQVRVEPHARFERAGRDLHMEYEVPMTTAALGGEIEVSCIDGAVTTRVEAGSQTGEQLVVKHRGLPRVGSSKRGDLIVHLRVMVPTKLDAEQEKVLRMFARLRDEEVAEHDTSLLGKVRQAFS